MDGSVKFIIETAAIEAAEEYVIPRVDCEAACGRDISPTAGGIYVRWGAKRQKIRTARGYAGCSFIMRGEIVLSGSSTI